MQQWVAKWCSHRFFTSYTIILSGISLVDQVSMELVSSLKWRVFFAGSFRLSNVNNTLLLWNFLRVSPKAMHNDFLLKRLNVTFFNLSQDNSSSISEMWQSTWASCQTYILCSSRWTWTDHNLEGYLYRHIHAKKASQIVPRKLTWSQFVWYAVIPHPMKLLGLIWCVSLKRKKTHLFKEKQVYSRTSYLTWTCPRSHCLMWEQSLQCGFVKRLKSHYN